MNSLWGIKWGDRQVVICFWVQREAQDMPFMNILTVMWYVSPPLVLENYFGKALHCYWQSGVCDTTMNVLRA